MDESSLQAFLLADDCDMPDMPMPDGPMETAGAVAVVNVHGILMDHPGMFDGYYGRIGYQDVIAAVESAVLDDGISAVLLNLHSPGGEAGGAMAAAEELYALRGIKPLVGIANSIANSAAYGLMAACDKAYITPSAQAGSVGAKLAHVDYSRALETAGVRMTVFRAGSMKAIGEPSEPLSEQAKAEYQAQVEGLRDLFASTVARFRGMEASDIAAMESRIYTGQAAVDAGLVDGINTFGGLLAELAGNPQEEPMGAPSHQRMGAPAARAASQVPDTMEAVLAAFPQAAAAIQKQGALVERTRMSELRALARDGFEAELEAAITQGQTPAEFCVALRKAEIANPARLQLAALRRDGDLGVSASHTVEIATSQDAGAGDDTPEKVQAKAIAKFKADAKLSAEFGGDFGVYLYSKHAEQTYSADELRALRIDLKKGA